MQQRLCLPIDLFNDVCCGHHLDELAIAVGQRKCHIGSGQRRSNDHVLCMLELGLGGVQELAPCRQRTEQLPYLDGCAAGSSNAFDAKNAATFHGYTDAAGLWVGEISVNAATVFVPGDPVLPAAAPAPIRILLHSDTGGTVRLLSQVTIMQTRSAEASIAPVPVLVVDAARLPFFEGIRERNGKRAGLRIDAVAFDMPRDTDPDAQSVNPINPADPDLIDKILEESANPNTDWASGAGQYALREDVDSAAIDSYLLFRSIRPPGLKEEYVTTLEMTGAIGPGKTIQTIPDSLVLDPFHRSNPFRHAFSQKHGKGRPIVRELEIVFDPALSVPDRLRGTFRDTLKGVTFPNIILTGSIELRRVSPVATLDEPQP